MKILEIFELESKLPCYDEINRLEATSIFNFGSEFLILVKREGFSKKSNEINCKW